MPFKIFLVFLKTFYKFTDNQFLILYTLLHLFLLCFFHFFPTLFPMIAMLLFVSYLHHCYTWLVWFYPYIWRICYTCILRSFCHKIYIHTNCEDYHQTGDEFVLIFFCLHVNIFMFAAHTDVPVNITFLNNPKWYVSGEGCVRNIYMAMCFWRNFFYKVFLGAFRKHFCYFILFFVTVSLVPAVCQLTLCRIFFFSIWC